MFNFSWNATVWAALAPARCHCLLQHLSKILRKLKIQRMWSPFYDWKTSSMSIWLKTERKKFCVGEFVSEQQWSRSTRHKFYGFIEFYWCVHHRFKIASLIVCELWQITLFLLPFMTLMPNTRCNSIKDRGGAQCENIQKIGRKLLKNFKLRLLQNLTFLDTY